MTVAVVRQFQDRRRRGYALLGDIQDELRSPVGARRRTHWRTLADAGLLMRAAPSQQRRRQLDREGPLAPTGRAVVRV